MSSRLPRLRPADLDVAQRELYDAVAGGPRAAGGSPFALVDDEGGLAGPFNAMLLAPALGGPLQALGSAIRYRGTLSARAREIAILVVARVWDSAFERYAHEAVGRLAGLTPAEMAALRTGSVDPFDDSGERLVATLTAALAERGRLSDAEFSAARDVLGREQLFELTTLVGYYATLAMQMRVFGVDGP